jgi:hypothetical protein
MYLMSMHSWVQMENVNSSWINTFLFIYFSCIINVKLGIPVIFLRNSIPGLEILIQGLKISILAKFSPKLLKFWQYLSKIPEFLNINSTH